MSATPTPFNLGVAVPFTFFRGLTYSRLPSGNASYPGYVAIVTDSPTGVVGATISAGGGSNVVLAMFNGTGWVVVGGVAGLPATQYASISGSTLAAANMAGAADCTLATSGATALTTPTAAQIIAAVPDWQIGGSYRLRVFNTNAGTLTLTGGTGVTIDGTATIATAVWRDYYVTYTAAATVVMQNIGAGTAD